MNSINLTTRNKLNAYYVIQRMRNPNKKYRMCNQLVTSLIFYLILLKTIIPAQQMTPYAGTQSHFTILINVNIIRGYYSIILVYLRPIIRCDNSQTFIDSRVLTSTVHVFVYTPLHTSTIICTHHFCRALKSAKDRRCGYFSLFQCISWTIKYILHSICLLNNTQLFSCKQG